MIPSLILPARTDKWEDAIAEHVEPIAQFLRVVSEKIGRRKHDIVDMETVEQRSHRAKIIGVGHCPKLLEPASSTSKQEIDPYKSLTL
jgi:hypothetical protein